MDKGSVVRGSLKGYVDRMVLLEASSCSGAGSTRAVAESRGFAALGVNPG
jgi:hypothetical protein